MQHTGSERDLAGSPLKNSTNQGQIESPMRSPGSASKRAALKSGGIKSKGSQKD
jgi:hypothetical protein